MITDCKDYYSNWILELFNVNTCKLTPLWFFDVYYFNYKPPDQFFAKNYKKWMSSAKASQQPHKKYTLKKRCNPTAQSHFLREYFFLHPSKTSIFSFPPFKKNKNTQPHRANLDSHSHECKSLRST